MPTKLTTDDFAEEKQLEQCQSYILQQLKAGSKPAAVRLRQPGPAVTISYQTGSGAHEIADRLAKLLQAGEPKGAVQWTVFDRNLVEKVLEEHQLPKSLAKFMPEDRRSYIKDVTEELLGLRPPSWVMVSKITETVLHLADAGHVILAGRGASFITARMPNIFHIRLIASLPGRIERVRKQKQLTAKEAAEFIKKEDRARGRYLKTHFHPGADDELLHHLVLNTDRFPEQDAAQLIADGARICFQKASTGEAGVPGKTLSGKGRA